MKDEYDDPRAREHSDEELLQPSFCDDDINWHLNGVEKRLLAQFDRPYDPSTAEYHPIDLAREGIRMWALWDDELDTSEDAYPDQIIVAVAQAVESLTLRKVALLLGVDPREFMRTVSDSWELRKVIDHKIGRE